MRGGALLLLPLLLLAGCPDSPGPIGSFASDAAPIESRAAGATARPTVVTPVPALAEIVCAIGGQGHLAGVSRYCVHPPALKDLPTLAGNRSALAQATWRHLLFGIVLGELERRLNTPADAEVPSYEHVISSNGHGSLEHAVRSP